MNFQPFAVVGIAIALCVNTLGAEQYDPPVEEAENLDTPAPDQSPKAMSTTETDAKVSLPYTPYPAGLSWVLTPQSFRVPIPDRIYYPPHTYVRRCPYYPRGYYWGANWRFNVIGRGNLLFFGPFRFNPYLTAAKAEHHKKTHGQKRYAPPPGPVGQAMLLGSSGPSAPVALPPTPAPDRGVGANVDSGYQTQADALPHGATVRLAAPRATARTASTRRSSR